MVEKATYAFAEIQARADLTHHIHHLLPLAAAELAALAGMTVEEVTQSIQTATACDHPKLAPALQTEIANQGAYFGLGLCLDLGDVLQGGHGLAMLDWALELALPELRALPDSLRAAVFNGIAQANALGLLPLPEGIAEADRLTRPKGAIAPALLAVARGMSADERRLVAQADYGDKAEQHLQALELVLGPQQGLMTATQYWYPSEVVELSAHVPAGPGFVGCTAILLLSAMETRDRMGWFDYRWPLNCGHYLALPEPKRWSILAGLRYLYETDSLSPSTYDKLPAILPVV